MLKKMTEKFDLNKFKDRVGLDKLKESAAFEKVTDIIQKVFKLSNGQLTEMSNILGIIISDNVVAVSEIEKSDDGVKVLREAKFVVAQDKGLEGLVSRSLEFKDFIREHGFKAHKAVVGISAKYLLTTQFEIGSFTDVSSKTSSVRMNLERSMNFEMSEVAADYWETFGSGGNKNSILAVTTLRKNIDALTQFFAASHIKPVSVTNTSLGLDLVEGQSAQCNIVILGSSIEVLLFENGGLKMLKHIPNPEGQGLSEKTSQRIVREINRASLGSLDSSSGPEYNLWERNGDSRQYDRELKTIFKAIEYKTFGEAATQGDETGLCTVATSLAKKTISRNVEIDFINSHLNETKLEKKHELMPKIKIASAVLVLLVLLFFVGWFIDGMRISKLEKNLASVKTDVAQAEQIIRRVNYARGWFSTSPVYLESLRELTLTFPEKGDIWLTSFAMDESLNQVISGRAIREQAVLDVVDKMNAGNSFVNVKTLYIRQMGKNSDLVTFAINFNYSPEK